MQIELDGKIYTVPDEHVQALAENLWTVLERMYDKFLPDSAKAGMMALTRTMLVKAEMEVRLKQGKEAARAMRPPPGTDPNLWIMRQYLPQLKGELEHATIVCDTNATGETITNFAIAVKGAGDAGRQVDIAGGERVWENNRAKVS